MDKTLSWDETKLCSDMIGFGYGMITLRHGKFPNGLLNIPMLLGSTAQTLPPNGTKMILSRDHDKCCFLLG